MSKLISPFDVFSRKKVNSNQFFLRKIKLVLNTIVGTEFGYRKEEDNL